MSDIIINSAALLWFFIAMPALVATHYFKKNKRHRFTLGIIGANVVFICRNNLKKRSSY